MKFGLMFFAASEDSLGADKYRLVVDSARFGDREGFSTVWVPERHFTAFGGLYPNPAVLHAALATCTSAIRLNAGSVVAPLHHPLRIAEEWSVVDNLSHGRVGLSFASGWNPDDFVLAPGRYEARHDHMLEAMDAVQRLWRGEPFEGTNGVGQPARVFIFPRPVQRELPVWLTVAGNPRNFERAGASGANLLTHLLDQDESVLAERIALYRGAREAAGFDPATGIVSLMIHTLVGADQAVVREQARKPYCNYIKANIGLFKGLAQSRGRDADLAKMSEADLDEFVNFLYDRFAAERGLIGTPESCAPLVSRLERIGVSELACLLDFGPDVDLVLNNLPHLARLKDLHASAAAPSAPAAAERFDGAAASARCTTVMTGDEFHRVLSGHGIQIDGAFRSIKIVRRRDGEAIADLVLGPVESGHHVHPASLDACGRVLAAALSGFGSEGAPNHVPTGFEACDLFAPLTGRVQVHAVVTSDAGAKAVCGDVSVYSDAGDTVARLTGLRLAPVEQRPASVAAGDLLYERAWEQASAPGGAVDAQGRWLLIADKSGIAGHLSTRIMTSGGDCTTASDDAPVRGIVYLAGLDAECGDDASTADVDGAVARALQGALAAAEPDAAPIWIVTRGAVPAAGEVASVAQAPLWGFGRALAVERPGALGALIDLDPLASADENARQLLQVLTGNRAEDMVAFRGGDRYVPRLRRIAPVEPAAGAIALDAGDTVLVTGGAGGLGVRLAEWLVSRGARRVLLCSRRPASAETGATLRRLRASGADIEVLQADVADAASLEAALKGRPAVTSVFHLAGVLDDGPMGEQTWDRVARVLAPKVAGAWNLHRLTSGLTLKHFVLFSSVSSMMPAPGQSSYAAANAFLDGLAHYRRARGLIALAVNWGPWSDAGHAATEYGGRAHARLASLGIESIAPADGLHALERLLRSDRAQAAAVAVDWGRLFRADAAARLGFISALAPRAEVKGQAHASSPFLIELAALPADERRPYLLQYLSDMVVAALKLRTDEPLDARQRLFDIGLDSIMALELKDRLERALGVPLSATLLFVRPTLDALADYILTDIVPPDAAESPAASEEELTRLLLREIETSRGA